MNALQITVHTSRVCVAQPPKALSDGYNPADLTLHVHREGVRKVFAIYPCVADESGKVCFLIDDDFANAKPGSYIGTVYVCAKPIHTIRMRIPRAQFGPAYTRDLQPCQDDDCAPKATCPPPPSCEDEPPCVGGCDKPCEPVCGCPDDR